jgi:hypothetical protein
MEYVALDAAGFRSPNMFGNPDQGALKEGWEPRRGGDNTQFQVDSRQMQKEGQDVYKIVGSAGYDYRATNTPYETGYDGVNNPGGASSSGCGRRFTNQIENYAPDSRYNYNYDNRMGQAQYQGYQSNSSKCNSGF